ncbi:LOW QUALITY PROTEIN: Sensor histidine kinase ChvG [Liberibacter crescens BT-1]|uniref:histidine kinase n=1 Tax=Liberibacter crescens (strain BT-1) TaxID=1215343 RepID=L0EUX7_LIBCB|nr:LOW QUALITY PROTEIN: Sensor histidine kinase ChvG [Liberibacter crescens BT-1]
MLLSKIDKTLDDSEGKFYDTKSYIWLQPITIIHQFFRNAVFSSLTRRILFFNLTALVFLVSGIMYLNQFRKGLIDTRVDSLLIQGEIIAGAISSSASADANSINIDPEKLMELKAGQSLIPSHNKEEFDFPINPERVAPILKQLILPTRTRARIFDADAKLLLDSSYLFSYSREQIIRSELPLVESKKFEWKQTWSNWFNSLLQPTHLPVYKELSNGDGSIYPEVTNSLAGVRGKTVRITDRGELMVSVSVPIQHFRSILGVLLLSTKPGDIDNIVYLERLAILRMAGVATLVNIALSLLLSSTIANPLRRLSAAAIRVSSKTRFRGEIPDFSSRQDEIGNLSIALREMTTTLYNRIDAIENFAADVSHELKNPLTSLRSAVETLPLAPTENAKKKILDIIQHDVNRLDRLISDISNASHLDAELARTDAKPVDLEALIGNLVEISRQISSGSKQVIIDYIIERRPGKKINFIVNGYDLRLGQVIINLIENARSFVPEESGRIVVRLCRQRTRCIVHVEDNGPGIQAENIDRIFERFYTDRPSNEAFGQNSGLGLSISRQIAHAHGGSLKAENIMNKTTNKIIGAHFILSLPAVSLMSKNEKTLL